MSNSPFKSLLNITCITCTDVCIVQRKKDERIQDFIQKRYNADLKMI